MQVANARTPAHSSTEIPQWSSNFQPASRHSWRTTVNFPSNIEQLPHELQHKIFTNLDYQSLIHLSTMNRYFHRTVNPRRMASPTDKAQFVMRAAKDFPQHRPIEKGDDFYPGNFECYICFRVRSPDKFDMLQPQSAFVDIRGCIIKGREPDLRVDKQVMLRRFCIECGVNEGIHAPFDRLTTRTGTDLWVCKCRKVWPNPGCLHCPDCRCPLQPGRKAYPPFANDGQDSCNTFKCLRGEEKTWQPVIHPKLKVVQHRFKVCERLNWREIGFRGTFKHRDDHGV